MKILIYCQNYLPLVGGLPIRMRILAEEFAAAGHEVSVATDTPGDDIKNDVVKTFRKLSTLEFFRRCRENDVLLSANVSLKVSMPLLLSGKHVFVAHGGGYFSNRYFGLLAKLKLAVCQRVNNIYNSVVVESWIKAPGVVLPNTYRTDIFKLYPDVERSNDIVCFGRLVSDKGFSLAVEALSIMVDDEQDRKLTIIGDGPEEHNWVVGQFEITSRNHQD